jgi:hypothetical protein
MVSGGCADPVLALIDRHRAAIVAFNAACELDHKSIAADKASEAEIDAQDALLGTMPQTEKGARAAHTYLTERGGAYHEAYGPYLRNLQRAWPALHPDKQARAATFSTERPDPVFAAIEAHRVALRALRKVKASGHSAEERDVYRKLFWTTPATLHGLHALLTYIGETSPESDNFYKRLAASPALNPAAGISAKRRRRQRPIA